jgi:hypothetical protein
MSPHQPPNPSKRDQLSEIRRKSPLQRGERIRLILMTGGLLTVIALFLFIKSCGSGDPSLTPDDALDTQTAGVKTQFPPVDLEQLKEVKDATTTDRLILEYAPFKNLLVMSKALWPGHLESIGNPGLDFENIVGNSADLRGSPVKLRGKLLDLSTDRRTVDGPEETWAHIQTDEGHHFWYVALNPPPLDLFTFGGNYVVVEGFYFKLHTRNDELGNKLTAPLLVGQGIRPSVRRATPALDIDLVLLADVVDSQFGDTDKIDGEGYWHLMNYAQTLVHDEERYFNEFDSAAPLNKTLLAEIAANPRLYRGKAVSIFGDPVRTWTTAAEENPLRLSYHSHTFLYKYEFGDQYVLLETPGKDAFRGLGLDRDSLAFFLRLWAYEDGDGNKRRVPVFVAAGSRPREHKTSLLESQIMQVFLALFTVLVIGFGWLIRRDKHQAKAAAFSLRQRRNRERKFPPKKP